MLSIYEAHEEKIKCQLYEPIYADEKVIDWQPSDKFCYCKEHGFQRTQEKVQGVRYKHVKGTLETHSLKNDEIDIDWKIEFDGFLYIIDSMKQEDDNKQQTYSKNCLVKTTLEVRR